MRGSADLYEVVALKNVTHAVTIEVAGQGERNEPNEKRRFQGHVLEDWSGEIGPRHKLVDYFILVAVDDLGDDVACPSGRGICSTLPLDPASRQCPGASLTLRHHQAG